MNKNCARCSKTVYTIEELKCLDKIWHKGCFRCQTCGMTLNMRNYKGFNKQPYCEAHIPKVKATTMAETPELKRIAENTKIQSNVKYHEDFEKSKGKFTQVADDPELKRIQQNSKIISNVTYHGDLEKKAAMEQKRSVNENGHDSTNMNNHMNDPNVNNTMSHSRGFVNATNVNAKNAVGKFDEMSAMNVLDHMSVVNNNDQRVCAAQSGSSQHPKSSVHHAPAVSRVIDAEPTVNSPYSSRQHQTLIYSSDRGPVQNQQPNIGSIADIDPLNNIYGSISRNSKTGSVHSNMNSSNTQHINGKMYRALFDYDAQDTDEVSFCDGDLIINVCNIRGGWMTGQVQRTGQVGMLPGNYVEPVYI